MDIFETSAQNISKMRPLEANRRALKWLCLYPADFGTGTRKRAIYVIVAITFMSLWFVAFLSSIAFFWRFVSNDFQTALNAFWQIVSLAWSLYAFVVMLFSRQKIKWTFESLSDIYKASKYSLYINV